MSDLPIEIFRCPATGLPLTVAPAEELARFNAWNAGQTARVLGDGTRLPQSWPAAWKTTAPDQQSVWYPLVDGIPILVPDAATRPRWGQS